MVNWINIKDKLPDIGGEYNVVWDLHDGEKPTVTTMEFDFKTKTWTDPHTGSDETENVLYYQELPQLPKHLKK